MSCFYDKRSCMRKTINIGGLKLSYLEQNPENELAILFLHGNSQAATTFHHQLRSPELSAYRLLALDLPGHGLSARSGSYSIPALVKSITEFVSELGLRHYVLAGHSLGGHLSLQALSEINPSGIFLSGTPPLSKPIDPSDFRPHPHFGVFYEQFVKDEELEILLDDLYTSLEERTAGKFEFLQTDPVFRPGLLASIGAMEFQDELVSWGNFRGEKRIVGGLEDKLINYENVKGKIPEAMLVAGGHNIHLENESGYTEVLSQFMNEIKNPILLTLREETLNG